MLHFAFTALLAFQNASGSPNVTGAVPPAEVSADPAQGVPDAPAVPTPRSRYRPTPVRVTPTPSAKGSDDQLIVVNKSDNSISILDAATGKTRWTVPASKTPHEAEVLAGAKMAAVSEYGKTGDPGRTVLLIDLEKGAIASKIDLGENSRPHGLKALRDGRLLITAEGTKELVVLDPRTGKLTQRIPTGRDVSHMVAASPDSRRAYVTSLASGSVTAIDLKTGKVLADIPTGKGAEGIDVSPDGREVWVTNRGANTISIVDAGTLKVVHTIRGTEFPIRVRFTPDGRRAVVAFTGSGDVGVYDTATRAEIKRIALGRDAVNGAESRVFQKRFGSSSVPVGLFIAPDGSRAWVAASHADVVAVIDLAKLRVEDAWVAGREPDGLAGRFVKKP
ncbi:MAG: cytochrome D1 domain-containing protein [Acidobacteriota bacterium]